MASFTGFKFFFTVTKSERDGLDGVVNNWINNNSQRFEPMGWSTAQSGEGENTCLTFVLAYRKKMTRAEKKRGRRQGREQKQQPPG